MKTILRLTILASLILGQFNAPYTAVSAQTDGTTPTATQEITETPTPEVTPSPEETETPITETPTPEATASPEETESPMTETPTLEATAIVEGTETVISPTETLTEVVVPEIHLLSLSSNPDFITPGGNLMLEWAIDPSLDGQGLVLQINIPAGFTIQGKVDGNYNKASRVLTVTIKSLSGQVHLKASDAVGDAIFHASLWEGKEVLSEAKYSLFTHEQFALDKKGGSVETKDGKISVEFPKDTFSEEAIVSIGKPSGDAIPPYFLSGHSIEIKAHKKSTPDILDKFDRYITLGISYADLNIPENLQNDIYIAWYNEKTEEWEALPSSVDAKTQTVYATTNHFTVFDININTWQASHVPNIDAFQISNFTGAATYSMPIEVPAGPAGLQPSLTLNYNSQVIDQATSNAQASWAGMGWSLDTGSIERNTMGTYETNDDTFFLNVNGVSSRIVKDPQGNYHLGDENFWKIKFYSGNPSWWEVKDKSGNTYSFKFVSKMLYNKGSVIGCGAPDIQTQEYRWELTSIKNIFGKEIVYDYTKETKDFTWNYFNDWCKTQSAPTDTAVYPKTIQYADGHYQIRFSLANRSDYTSGWETDWDHHSFMRKRLSTIFVEQDLDGVGGYETLIRKYVFTYLPNNDAGIIWPGIEWSKGGQTLTLKTVQQFGLQGVSSLPSYTFTYGDNMHLTRAENSNGTAIEFDYDSDPNAINSQIWYYDQDARDSYTIETKFGISGYPCDERYAEAPWGARDAGSWVECYDEEGNEQDKGPLHVKGTAHAENVQNISSSEYGVNSSKDLLRPGGMYKITTVISKPSNMTAKLGLFDGNADQWNTQPGPYSPAFIKLPVNASKVEPLIKITGGTSVDYGEVHSFKFQLLTSIYRVQEKRVFFDINQEPYTYTYDYSINGVDSAKVNDSSTSSVLCDPNDTNCREYVEAFSEFRGNQRVTETGPDGRKTLTQFNQDDALKGRVKWALVKDGSTDLSRKIYTYTSESLPVSQPGWVGDCTGGCFYIGITRNWVYTDYEENILYALDGTPYTTRTDYQFESVYGNLIEQAEQTGSGSNWTPYRKTIISYFPNATGTTYLVGLPARQRVEDNSGTVLAQVFNFYDNNTTYNTSPTTGKLTRTRTLTGGGQYSQADYQYNGWGNQTGITVYSGYAPSPSEDPTTGTVATTTTDFDPIFHVYPKSQKTPPTTAFPAGLLTTWGYDSNLDGQDDFINGAPNSQTDPNGNTTLAQYDSFGRIEQLIRLGDDSTNPTIKIDYHDVNRWTEINQRIDGTRYLTIRRYYDGLGRQTSVQTGHKVTVNGTFSLDNTVSYQYPAFNIVSQSMPYKGIETPVYTETVYDVLGRPLTVSPPDGNGASYSYDGLITRVTDARQNTTTSTADIWGRVVSVVPPTGPAVGYVYDQSNNLTKAIRASLSDVQACLNNPSSSCPAGKTVSLGYDRAGRKTSMSDPDMGSWTYTYDALGNLKTQTDARTCMLTLGYDLLNRLTSKVSSGSGCGTAVNTTYAYDNGTGANGKGRRTSMTDASGSTLWYYDTRGRVVKETKTISGNQYVTQWGYNSADLNTWIKYPDNEIVNNTYDDRMSLDTVFGTNTYVSDTQYDSAGRMDLRSFGNNTQTGYVYYPWDTQGGRLQTVQSGTTSDTDSLQDLAYSYDSVGNIAQISNNITGVNEKQTFRYDNLDRLRCAGLTTLDGTSSCETSYNPANDQMTTALTSDSNEYAYNATSGNLELKDGLTLQYTNGAHAHAVSSAGSNNYSYDANGNQITRVISADTFTLIYDAENRLTEVKKNSATQMKFTYDGDGKRVKSETYTSGVVTETILFVGGHYEIKNPGSGQEVTKYYLAGTSRVAIRKYVIPQTTTLTYLLGDHLGSTSIATDTNGNLVTETRYKPWGEVRSTKDGTGADSTLPTRYTYTGQYSYMDDSATDLGGAGFGLMFYNARWYDPVLGRFAQADTIIPSKEVNPYLIVSYNETDFLNQLNQHNTEVLAVLRGEKDKKVEQININSQGFDRFSYTNNNPMNFNDPTGHCGDPVSGTACLALIATGPIGWIIIGGLVIIDVVLIANLVNTWDSPTITTTTTTTETTTLDLVATAHKPDIDFVDYLQRKYGLGKAERRILHDLITRQGLTEEEIEAEAAELARLKRLREQKEENQNAEE